MTEVSVEICFENSNILSFPVLILHIQNGRNQRLLFQSISIDFNLMVSFG